MLIQAATGAIKVKNSYYKAKHDQLRFKLGSYNKATVAIANRMARAIYHIIKSGSKFKDLYAIRVESNETKIARQIAKLKSLGVEVKYHVHQKIVEAKSSHTVLI